MNKIALIIDDDRTERRLIVNALRGTADFSFVEAENGRDALRIIQKDVNRNIALIILDLEMPVMGGLEMLESIGQIKHDIPIIVLTGSIDMAHAVRATQLGAVDFLTKPVVSARLDVSVRNVLKMKSMSREIGRLQRRSQNNAQFSDMIGFDQGLRSCVEMGKKAAPSDLPVLITGETGTGKELLASAIHGESKRAGAPFITVNCGAIPANLVESILFGHEKGAFTGATNKATGKFLEANGGTIFLDEIGELPLDAQVKLLRVLQQQEVQPVGAAQVIPVNVRILSATNRDLAKEISQKRFREDLFFRLNVLHIELPPLRKRQQDIPALTAFFVGQYCTMYNKPLRNIPAETLESLQRHNWPGNVRELENVINRTLALSEGKQIEKNALSFLPPTEAQPLTSKQGNALYPLHEDGTCKTFHEMELEFIAAALKHHDHNITQTAKTLGIAKSTLYTKMQNLADQKRTA